MNLELIAIAGIFTISALLIYYRFDLALYLLIILSVLLHKELFSFYRWDLMPIRAFSFAVFCVFVWRCVHALVHRNLKEKILHKYLKDPVILGLLGLLTINGASLIFSLNLKASILLYGFFVTSIVLVINLFNHFKKDHTISEKFLNFYIIVTFALTLFGYFQYYLYSTTGKIIGALWNIPNNIPRIGSTFWDVNHYGALIAVLLPISAVYVLSKPKWSQKITYLVISISLTTSLLLTNSRTAWIIDFVALIVFGLILLIRKYGLKGILFVVTPLIILSAGFGLEYSKKDSPFRARIKQYFHYRMDSFDSHILLLRGSFEIFEQYPILGGGYGSFFEHFNKTKVSSIYFARDPAAFNTRVPAHTIWGELLSGSGALGFSAFLFVVTTIIGMLIFVAFNEKEKSKYMVSAAMAAGVVGWLTAGVFYSYNSEFFWIILALFFSYGFSLSAKQLGYTKVLEFFSKSKKLALSLVVITAFTMIFINLGTNSLIPWDEAIYAKIAKNMANSGDFIQMTWKPMQIWYEKPPLYMWISAGLMKILGFGNLAPRLPSAFFGFLLVILVYKFSERLFGRLAGFISAICLLTTTHFLYYSRTGMFDVSSAFFITLTFYIYWFYATKHTKWSWLFFGITTGVATMIKGVIGMLPIPIIFLSEMLIYKRFLFKKYFIAILGWAIVAVPWHLEMTRRFGMAFWGNYLGYHVVNRAISAIEDKGNPFWWYFIVVKVGMRLWIFPFIAGIISSFNRAFLKYKQHSFLIIWASFIFIFFSAAQSKLVWYIMPFYPVAAIITGYFVSEFLARFSGLTEKIPSEVTKFVGVYSTVLLVFLYFFLNRGLVYVGDLTGSAARLLQKKDEVFGANEHVYVDRIEVPIALYYTDGPFTVVDFSPTVLERVPLVREDKKLILLTKKGRFSTKVERYSYDPTVVAEDGDYILWYFAPQISRL